MARQRLVFYKQPASRVLRTHSVGREWHEAEVFGTAAIPSGNSVTFRVLAGQPACLLVTQIDRVMLKCYALELGHPHIPETGRVNHALLESVDLLPAASSPASGRCPRRGIYLPERGLPEGIHATIGGELSFPKGKGPFPVVILMHPCGGLEPIALGALRAHAKELAGAGFSTLILDSYGARNLTGGKVCGGGIKTGFRVDDAFNAMRALQGHEKVSKENIFLLGQSDGGNAAPSSAQGGGKIGNFRAVAAYYPGCGWVAQNIVSPTIVFVGGRDDWTPPELCIKAKSTSAVKGAEFEVVSYPNAYHSFDQVRRPSKYRGYTLVYDHAATVDSRTRLRAFFIKHLTDELRPVPPFSGKAK